MISWILLTEFTEKTLRYRAGVYEQIEYLVAKEEYKIVLDIMDSTGDSTAETQV